jgi:hypothetical protein
MKTESQKNADNLVLQLLTGLIHSIPVYISNKSTSRSHFDSSGTPKNGFDCQGDYFIEESFNTFIECDKGTHCGTDAAFFQNSLLAQLTSWRKGSVISNERTEIKDTPTDWCTLEDVQASLNSFKVKFEINGGIRLTGDKKKLIAKAEEIQYRYDNI